VDADASSADEEVAAPQRQCELIDAYNITHPVIERRCLQPRGGKATAAATTFALSPSCGGSLLRLPISCIPGRPAPPTHGPLFAGLVVPHLVVSDHAGGQSSTAGMMPSSDSDSDEEAPAPKPKADDVPPPAAPAVQVC